MTESKIVQVVISASPRTRSMRAMESLARRLAGDPRSGLPVSRCAAKGSSSGCPRTGCAPGRRRSGSILMCSGSWKPTAGGACNGISTPTRAGAGRATSWSTRCLTSSSASSRSSPATGPQASGSASTSPAEKTRWPACSSTRPHRTARERSAASSAWASPTIWDVCLLRRSSGRGCARPIHSVPNTIQLATTPSMEQRATRVCSSLRPHASAGTGTSTGPSWYQLRPASDRLLRMSVDRSRVEGRGGPIESSVAVSPSAEVRDLSSVDQRTSRGRADGTMLCGTQRDSARNEMARRSTPIAVGHPLRRRALGIVAARAHGPGLANA